MLDLGGTHEWRPPILETVATDGKGIAELWDAVVDHRSHLESGQLEDRRRARMRVELDKVLSAMVRSRVGAMARGDLYEGQIDSLLAGTTDPYRAAETLLGDA
jgi:LAO/AO transport system kinase